MTLRHLPNRNYVVSIGSVAVLAVGIGAPSGTTVSNVSVPEGFDVAEFVTELDQPTQIVIDGEDLLVAQINGGEGDGTGQILRISLEDPARRDVLFDDLLKPTGVAVLDDEVWVMEERTLSRGPLEGGELEEVLTDLPYNGRSQGTLTVTPDGRLLYNTSGTISGLGAAEGSATLWALTPGEDPEVLATGFKHAYARTFDADGTLWQTEMSDGTYDGEPAPDELVMVEAGDDFGWPRCIGDRQPVEFYEGTAEYCDTTPRSHALFEPGATPTSVAVAPWDDTVLMVALWVEGRVVAVPVAGPDVDGQPVDYADFLTGIERPQHLLADGDRLLVVDYGDGRILEIEES